MKFCTMYFKLLLLISPVVLFNVQSAPSIQGEENSVNKQEPKSVNCSSFPGAVQPQNLKNSAYYLLNNGSLCCPPRNCPSSTEDMKEECGARGVVDDPCFLCMTCAKLKGEDCHGHQYRLGRCGPGLSCININGTVLTDHYDEGICTDEGGFPTAQKPGSKCGGKFNYLGSCESDSLCFLEQDKDYGVCQKHAKTKQFNQRCGGSFGRLGRCMEGLRCAVDEDEFLKGADIDGVCYSDTAEPVCFKNCSMRLIEPVCGDNGRWYKNICYLRQSNCPLLSDERRVRKIPQQTEQESVCKGIKPGYSESIEDSASTAWRRDQQNEIESA